MLAKPLELLHELMVARSDVLMEDAKVKPPPSSVPAAKELQVGTRLPFLWLCVVFMDSFVKSVLLLLRNNLVRFSGPSCAHMRAGKDCVYSCARLNYDK